MSSNKDFLPSSSPRSSICAVEIEAILFFFMMNCYKSSFQECITIIVLKIDRQGTSRHIVHFSYKKKEDILPPPVGLSWDSPHPPPKSVRVYADVRTKIFRFNGFIPNLLTHGAPRAALLKH